MPEMSPQEWLDYLSEKLMYRLPEMTRIQRYVNDDPPLPTGATEHRAAYVKFQKMSKTNFAELSVEAPAERIRIAGFRVGNEGTDNDSARALWRRSRGGATASDIHRDALTYGYGYGMAAKGRFGAILTHESPFGCITEHDPLDPSWVQAGLKMWSDLTYDHAVLHLPGMVYRFVRAVPERIPSPAQPEPWRMGAWEFDGAKSGPTGLDRVPIVRFENRDGVGVYAKHTDLLDRINWVILQRLLIIAMQAFRQRAVKGELPKHDEEGNLIDYEAMFAPGPDALWTLPDGVDIWESQPGDIQQILGAAKDDIGQFAALTRTPMSTLMPGDGQNQTAEGAAFAREGLVFKSEDCIERWSPDWDTLVPIGLALDGISAEVETQWKPAERQSLAERFDALTKAGDLPWRDRMTDVLGYDAARVDQMEINRARDLALAADAGGRELSVAEMVQKLYLGVDKVISAEEAREILAASGADIDPAAEFMSTPPAPVVVEVPDAEDDTKDPEDEPTV